MAPMTRARKTKQNINQVMVGKKPTVQSNALSHNGPESKQNLLKYPPEDTQSNQQCKPQLHPTPRTN